MLHRFHRGKANPLPAGAGQISRAILIQMAGLKAAEQASKVFPQ